MADYHGLLFAKRRHQGDHVADIVKDGVGADIGRRTAAAKAAHVGRHDVEAGVCDRGNLVPPGLGQLGPAMAEQHQRPLTLFENKQVDPVGGNGA